MNETVQEFDLMKNMPLFKQGASASLVFNNALSIHKKVQLCKPMTYIEVKGNSHSKAKDVHVVTKAIFPYCKSMCKDTPSKASKD